MDSAKEENDFAVFKNVFNDYYAKDTSKKIRAVVKIRGEAGELIAGNPPYGYVEQIRIPLKIGRKSLNESEPAC